MTTFLAAARSISIELGGDEDTADKLSCRYTVVLLIVFCVVISTKQYVGEPIVCWVPASYTVSMREYTENMCWIKNTYYVAVGDTIPSRDEDIRASSEINYYQWVPIMLVVQALLFYGPSLVWRSLNQRSGCNIRSLCSVLTDSSMIGTTTRGALLDSSSNYLHSFLSSKSRRADAPGGWLGRLCSYACRSGRYGNSLVFLYMCVKLLYVINVVAQIFLLNAFLGNVSENYGYDALLALLRGAIGGSGSRASAEERESIKFPRSTLCSFRVREFGGNVHRHTVQCVLPINLFNEKIYIFLWFWFVLVAVASTISLATWAFEIATKPRVRFCEELLSACRQWPPKSQTANHRGDDRLDEKSLAAKPTTALRHGMNLTDDRNGGAGDNHRGALRNFANHYLRSDGVFLLRLLCTNVNRLVVSQITYKLYELYQEETRKGESGAASDDEENDDGNKPREV